MLPIYPHSSRHGELARKLRGVAARTRASIVFVTTLLACSASATSVGIDPLDVVRQVVAEKCASCHSGQGPGPFALLTDGDLARHGPTMVRAVETTLMPPWLPAASASGLRDECRLSTDEIAAFRAWKAAGFPLTPRGENPWAGPLSPAPRALRREPGTSQPHRTHAVESRPNGQSRHRLQTQNRRLGQQLPHPTSTTTKWTN